MKTFIKRKNISIALLLSFFAFVVVKAATPYTLSVTTFNDDEFPRVQAAIDISGDTNGLLARHIEIVEGSVNTRPLIFMPPHAPTGKIDLHILLDTSARTAKYQTLIRTNLKALATYFYDSEIDTQIRLVTFDGAQSFVTAERQKSLVEIDALVFNSDLPATIDGFNKISQEASQVGRSGTQKIMLIINGSAFVDNKTDGVSGFEMQQAINSITSNDYLAFVLGHPLRKLHAMQAEDPMSGLVDFSHSVSGGYLGGFGVDLTSLVDLLKMQSSNDFILQYYSLYGKNSFLGSQALIRIDAHDAHNFTYDNFPSTALAISHVPVSEVILGEDVLMEIDLGNSGKMINAVEINYKNSEGVFESESFFHQRAASTSESLKYLTQVSSQVMSDENFSYFISVETPYSSVGAGGGLITVPVNAYDDGIILHPTLVNNEEVLWSWDGPTVAKGKSFEVWSGDTLLTTTAQKNYTIPLTDCNHYQIIQVKVLLKSNADHPKAGTWSYPSRPYEYYAEVDGSDGPINERDSVLLMIKCINDKEIDTYTKIAGNTPGFNASANIDLERAGLYLAKIIAEDIWKKIETQSDYYELIYYIMRFITRDEYIAHGIEGQDVKTSMIHKLVTVVNHTDDIDTVYNDALRELSNRLRGNTSF